MGGVTPMKKNRYYKDIIVRTCKKCKKIIDEKSLYDYCPECFNRVEQVFIRIREYIETYPGATAFEIEQETGIAYHVINNFVREGRLVEIPNRFLNIECRGCGCLLLSAHHKYCPDCRRKLERDLETAKVQLNYKLSDDGARMHLEEYRSKL
jgi:hypothetical protein